VGAPCLDFETWESTNLSGCEASAHHQTRNRTLKDGELEIYVLVRPHDQRIEDGLEMFGNLLSRDSMRLFE